MTALVTWLTAVASVSLLLSLVRLLVPKGALGDTAAFIGGLILLIVMLEPLVHIDPAAVSLDTQAYRQAVEQRRQALTQAQAAEWKRRIEADIETYISDKAQTMGLSIQIRITAQAGDDGVPMPVLVELTGPWSQPLSQWLEETVGLPAERQVWNEN